MSKHFYINWAYILVTSQEQTLFEVELICIFNSVFVCVYFSKLIYHGTYYNIMFSCVTTF